MTEKKITNEMIEELYSLIVSVDNVTDCRALFDDLCTYNEIKQMAQRVKAAKLLLEGKTYSQVIEQTDISSATLSRVSRCVQTGTGYSKLLNKE